MENSNTFTYNYSAPLNNEIETIGRKYLPKEENKLARLKELDRRARRAGLLQSLTLGIIGCLIFGVGMCLGLEVLAGGKPLAITLGAIGTLIMLPAYGIYRRIQKKTKAKLTPEILRLSEELTSEKSI